MRLKTFVVLIAMLVPVAARAATDSRTSGIDDAVVRALRLAAGDDSSADVRVRSIERSLTGTHIVVAQYIEGREVVNGGTSVTLRNDGAVASERRVVRSMRSRNLSGKKVQRPNAQVERVLREREVVYAIGSEGVIARELTLELPSREVVVGYFATDDGRELERYPLSFSSKRAAVFVENPVTTLNDPNLNDHDDSPAAVPANAYSVAELEVEVRNGRLFGSAAHVNDDFFPLTPSIDAAASLEFDRGDPRFEEVMTYFHIARSKARLQQLGYEGTLEILDRPVSADAHGTTDDRSIYTAFPPGRGRLLFGDGGVDDAEDPDVINHELAHVIHDSIIPGVLAGPVAGKARALAEGFADYWAFSMAYAGSRASGRDPFCIGDWDVRCGGSTSDGCAHPPATDCLRRVDSEKTMADYARSGFSGVEYANGEIWSSFLVSMFNALVERHGPDVGRLLADRLVIESLFGMPANPTFATVVARIADTDVALNGGENVDAICTSTVSSGIISAASACRSAIPGSRTLYPGLARNVTIPDNDTVVLVSSVRETRLIENIHVAVDIEHEHRGDLRLTLIDPSGRRFLLQQTSRNDADDDVLVTFGLDAAPLDSFDTLRGFPAVGDWRLEVADTAANDRGIVRDWGVILEFEQQEPIPDDPIRSRVHTYALTAADDPLLGKISADLYLTNSSKEHAPLLLSFRPNGAPEELELRLGLPAGAATRLRDVARRTFSHEGDGILKIYAPGKIESDVRIVVAGDQGRLGSRAPVASADTTTNRNEEPLQLIALEFGPSRRASITLAEISGVTPVVVDVDFLSLAGALVEQRRVEIAAGGIASVEVSTVDTARAVARVVSEGGVLFAFSDARLLHTRDLTLFPATRSQLPRHLEVEAGRVDSLDGRKWSMEILVSNTSADIIVLPVLYVSETVSRSLSLALRPGETKRLGAATFVGPKASLGHVELDVPAGVLAAIQLRNTLDEVVVVEALEWRRPDQLLHQQDVSSYAFVEADTSTRTNVGLTEMSGATANVLVRFADAFGETVSSVGVALPANGAQQVAAPAGTATVTITVISGEGAVAAGVSRIDRGTGDSAYTALISQP